MALPRRFPAVLALCVVVGASSALARAFADKKHPVEEAGLKSGDGDIEATITFVNKGKKTVKIYWLDHEGERVHYKTLEADETHEQPTFLAHPWLITDEDGDARAVYFPDGQPRTVEIAEPAKK